MQHELGFQFKARYHKLGELNPATKQVWWVLHGYGQLAQFFIQKFRLLSEQGICVIAPEGLSRFYLSEYQAPGRANNRVGATWMTRENRQMDIENYVNYLDAILQIETSSVKIPTTLFGFSQGAATAIRWAMNGKINFGRLILWAGLFPPDMDFEKGATLLTDKKIIEVIGNQDPFLNQEKINEWMQLNQKLKVNPTIIKFDGKHEIDEDTLKRIISD